jgi:hypothetical protein
MGCWHETCAISHLPIIVGEGVYWLLLTKNPYKDHEGQNGCYVADHWYVRNVPMLGKYDDYGQIEKWGKNEAVFEKTIMGQFRLDLIQNFAEEHTKAIMMDTVSNENLSVENLFRWFNRGYVRIDKNVIDRELARERLVKGDDDFRKAHYEKQLALEVEQSEVISVLVKKKVWEFMCRDKRLEEYYKNELLFCDTVITHDKEERRPTSSSEYHAATRFDIIDVDGLFRQDIFNMATFLPFTMSPLIALNMVMRMYCRKEIGVDLLRRFVKRMVELAFVQIRMSSLRIGWQPTTGAGSQATNLDEHLAFHVTCAKLVETMGKRGYW